jgi:hypothetical protein
MLELLLMYTVDGSPIVKLEDGETSILIPFEEKAISTGLPTSPAEGSGQPSGGFPFWKV